MIQILGIRKGFDPEKQVEYTYDTRKHSPPKAPNPGDILLYWQKYIDLFPEDERYNLFFTQYDVAAHFRSFKAQYVMPFDIDFKVDGVYHEPEPEILALPALQNPYIILLAQHLKIPPEKLGVIFTGHGYHILASLLTPFGKDYFEKNRIFYNSLCASINASYKQANLLGTLDTQFFKSGLAGFRLPGSENRKPGRPSVVVRVLKADMDCVDIDLQALSGLPVVKEAEQVVNYGPVDTEGVLNGCDFLKHCKAEPNSVSYGAWYGMLSIVGRCQDGEKLAQEYSKGHKSYNEDETKQKLEEAIASSGPRTCQNIGTLPGWSADKCKGCKHYGVKSPISIRSKDFIATASTGFHTISVGPKGLVHKPNYKDLRQQFDKEYGYKCIGSTRNCYIWTGTHYEAYELLENYAQDHFDPYAQSHMTEEFKRLIWRTNSVHPDWFKTGTEGVINFKNGVLDLKSRELAPHSRDRGFRYVLPYDYDESATSPVFDKFLDNITCGDKDLAKLIMDFVGYCFSGNKCEREVLILTGKGRNGKSTLLNLLRALGGTANVSSFCMSHLKNETDCQLMDGKLFNLSDETSRTAWDDTEYFKNLSSGGQMKCRALYKQAYTVTNKTKFILSVNELPNSTDQTEAFFSRLLIVPFNAYFALDNEDTDSNLDEKLIAELPGIFNRVLEGYDRWKKLGRFTTSDSVKEALQEFKDHLEHPAIKWVRDSINFHEVGTSEKFMTKHQLYKEYKSAMTEEGMREFEILGLDAFGKKVNKIIPDLKRRYELKKISGKVTRVLKSTELRTLVRVEPVTSDRPF